MYKQSVATLEAELEIVRKQDEDNREQLKKVSSQMHKNKAELLTTKENLTGRKYTSTLRSIRTYSTDVTYSYIIITLLFSDI